MDSLKKNGDRLEYSLRATQSDSPLLDDVLPKDNEGDGEVCVVRSVEDATVKNKGVVRPVSSKEDLKNFNKAFGKRFDSVLKVAQLKADKNKEEQRKANSKEREKRISGMRDHQIDLVVTRAVRLVKAKSGDALRSGWGAAPRVPLSDVGLGRGGYACASSSTASLSGGPLPSILEEKPEECYRYFEGKKKITVREARLILGY